MGVMCIRNQEETSMHAHSSYFHFQMKCLLDIDIISSLNKLKGRKFSQKVYVLIGRKIASTLAISLV